MVTGTIFFFPLLCGLQEFLRTDTVHFYSSLIMSLHTSSHYVPSVLHCTYRYLILNVPSTQFKYAVRDNLKLESSALYSPSRPSSTVDTELHFLGIKFEGNFRTKFNISGESMWPAQLDFFRPPFDFSTTGPPRFFSLTRHASFLKN